MTLWENATPHAAGYREADVQSVAAQAGKIHLVDVREPNEFVGELGHAPGAELVPLATIAVASAAWDRAAEHVVVCRSGGRSGRAADLLVKAGFTRVVNVAGGMLAWNAAHLPTER
jgi:rhodanese-related sulfurtransferase